MTLFALTGPSSLSSSGSWSEAEVIELDKKLFDSLKHNQIIFIHYQSSYSGETVRKVKVGRRTHSKKYNQNKIKLDPVINAPTPKTVKPCPYYLYERNGRVDAAHGDLAIVVTRVRK